MVANFTYIYIYIYIYISVISSRRPKTMGMNYSCTEYMRNFIWIYRNIFRHYLPDKILKHSYVPGCGPYCFEEGVVVDYDLDLTNKFGSSLPIKKIRVKFPNCHTFVITIGIIQFFFFSSAIRLIRKHSEIFVFAFPVLMWNNSACRFKIFRRVNCVILLLFTQTVLCWL